MTMTHIDAAAAKAMFPKVIGPIFGADLWSGFAILDMGTGAYGVMVGGKFVACSPDYTSAKENGENAANAALAAEPRRMPKTVTAFALKHKIRLGATYATDHKGIAAYYVLNAVGLQVASTMSDRPTAKQALAMCRRYLARKAGV
jgi:hypothetical protein